MNEGVEVVSVRLSWDHLAHLIKHRSFNLAFSFRCRLKQHLHHHLQRIAADSRKTVTRTDTPIRCQPVLFVGDTLVHELTFATHRFLVCPPDLPVFSSDAANCAWFHWCIPRTAEPLACCLTTQFWEWDCSTSVAYCTLPETVFVPALHNHMLQAKYFLIFLLLLCLCFTICWSWDHLIKNIILHVTIVLNGAELCIRSLHHVRVKKLHLIFT